MKKKKKKRLNVCSGIDHALRKYHMQQITIQTIILYVCECILIHHHREKEKITRERVRYERKHHSTMHVFLTTIRMRVCSEILHALPS